MAQTSELNLLEFEPLTKLLKAVPHRSQKGLLNHDLEWTCVDVTKEFIAFGTNSSILYLYHRETDTVEKLHIRTRGGVITCVRLINSVDYEVAVGTNLGLLFIFVLPSLLPGKNKQLQMFRVSGLHASPIRCVEWSQNAMKLFSGDEDGVVVCTEIDYTTNQSHSYLVCKEPHEVVQLSYAFRTLLVSTTYRSLLCAAGDSLGKVTQLGQKDRKMRGVYGGVFGRGMSDGDESVIFAARPGLRLWKAKIDGTVTATYIFRDLLTSQQKNISLLADTTRGVVPHHMGECQFGRLLMYQDSLIVTYHDTELFIIDTARGSFSSYHTNLGPILNVAVSDDEIFILRRVVERPLIRLAYSPDQHRLTDVPSSLPLVRDAPGSEVDGTSSMRSPDDTSPVQILSDTASKVTQSLVGAMKGVGEKLQSVQEETRKSLKQRIPTWSTAPPGGGDRYYNNMTRSSDSAQSSVDSATELSPSYVPSPELSSPEQLASPKHLPGTSSDNLTRTSLPKDSGITDTSLPQNSGMGISKISMNAHNEIPPIVKLDGDNLTIIKIERTPSQQSYGEQNVTVKANSQDRRSGSPSHGSRHGTFDAVGRQEFEEVVYYRKAKKMKQKKSKSECAAGDAESEEASLNSSPGLARSSPLSVTRTHTPSPDKVDSAAEPAPGAGFSIDLEKLTSSDGNILEELMLKDDTEEGEKNEREPREEPVSHTHPSQPPPSSQQPVSVGSVPEHTMPARAPSVSSLENWNSSHSRTCEPLSSEGSKTSEPVSSNSIDLKTSESVSLDSSFSKTGEPLTLVGPDVETGEPSTSDSSYSKAGEPVTLDSSKTSEPVSLDKAEIGTEQSSGGNSFEYDNSTKDLAFMKAIDPLEIGDSKDFVGTLPVLQSPTSPQASKSTESDSDDFYSKYRSHSQGGSTDTPLESDQDIQSALDEDLCGPDPETRKIQPYVESPSKIPIADAWMDFSTPIQVHNICLTSQSVWIMDRYFRVFRSPLNSSALRWSEVPDPAKQLAVSPSGSIVWRLLKGLLYVAMTVTTQCPSGKNWVNISKDVAHVAVDDNMAWYIKTSGEIGMHKDLSRSCPHNRYIKVDCPHALVQVACCHGVVWALTTERNIIVRDGIRDGREQGLSWRFLQGDQPCQLVSSFSFGGQQTAWILDIVGRVWFTTGVTTQKPCGDGQWWQVSMSAYLMQDSKASLTLQSLLGVSQNLGKLISSDKGGMISAGTQGVWMCQGHKDVIHVCRGSMLGHRWENVILGGMLSSTRWQHVSATGMEEGEGLVWAQQSNGSFFAFPSRHKHARVLEVLPPVTGQICSAISATREAVWVLLSNGAVFIRGGMGPHCPQGIKWVPLNLAQLGSCMIVHICCGTENVWAVDDTGQVYMRIGNRAPTSAHLSPAWVPVDGCPKDPGAKFIQIYVGPDDRMVWGLDNKMNVYVRRGISDNLPVGNYWSYVSGTPALTLCISDKMVYAQNPSGEVLARYGVSERNIDGDYWKKIPGAFVGLSVTSDDELWAVDSEGMLHKRHLHYLERRSTRESHQASRAGSTEDGWELL